MLIFIIWITMGRSNVQKYWEKLSKLTPFWQAGWPLPAASGFSRTCINRLFGTLATWWGRWHIVFIKRPTSLSIKWEKVRTIDNNNTYDTSGIRRSILIPVVQSIFMRKNIYNQQYNKQTKKIALKRPGHDVANSIENSIFNPLCFQT